MAYRQAVIVLVALGCCVLAWADEEPVYSYTRVFAAAKADPAWAAAPEMSSRMWLVREYARKQGNSTKPVSDRYTVTCYGGSIDLVHFFALAAEVGAGSARRGPRLYKEWIAEGGREALRGFNRSEPPEAHPDDLPSNALGALFGEEHMAHQNDPEFDLEGAFAEFIAPLIPVPDKVAKRFSHFEIVMGLYGRPTLSEGDRMRSWFTAAPLVQTAKLNAAAQEVYGKPLCKEVADGEAGLALAGFAVKPYKKRPILIERVGP